MRMSRRPSALCARGGVPAQPSDLGQVIRRVLLGDQLQRRLQQVGQADEPLIEGGGVVHSARSRRVGLEVQSQSRRLEELKTLLL